MSQYKCKCGQILRLPKKVSTFRCPTCQQLYFIKEKNSDPVEALSAEQENLNEKKNIKIF